MIGDPSDLWRRIGKALWHVQLAEYSLVNFYVATRLDKNSCLDLEDLLERNFKPTVGVIVGNLRQAGVLNEIIDKQISEFVAERNWLAHHIRRLNNSDIYHEHRYAALLGRLDALQSASDAISLGATHWLDGWAASRGLTRDEIEEATASQLKLLRGEV
jgi:hypothetical protein